MAGIPFKRVAAAFDEIARARPCQSSGSEYSAAGNSPELSDLINSFIEKDDQEDNDKNKKIMDFSDSETTRFCSENSNSQDVLVRNLLGNECEVSGMIRAETEHACKIIGISSDDEGFKRLLMSRLRERAFDAGLCKSRLKKIGQFLAGDYEYIDVMVNGTRYIVEVNLAREFTIARPADHYQSLLDVFPPIYVGEPDDLKQVVKLMGTAVKKSMKSSDMHVPIWRKNGYMLAKWFGSYKRTTSTVSKMLMSDSVHGFAKKKAVGFEMSPPVFHYCRGELYRKADLRVGNLAQMFGDRNSN